MGWGKGGQTKAGPAQDCWGNEGGAPSGPGLKLSAVARQAALSGPFRLSCCLHWAPVLAFVLLEDASLFRFPCHALPLNLSA